MATSTRSTVVGVFNERHDAERAIDALKRHGFHDDQIGIAVRDQKSNEGTIQSKDDAGDAGGGAATGALTGGVVGGVLGALAAGLIPGIGPVLAGGLLAGVLGGAAAGAAAGGLIGALAGMGVPEDEAKYYNEEFESGRTLVTVKADGQYDEARRILQDHGAYDIENRGGTAAATMPRQSAVDTATRTDRANVTDVPERRHTNSDEMELREEELTARKERTEAGKVEIEKDVVTEHRAMDVPVTREEVTVSRRPADRRPTGDRINDNEEIEMELSEEEVVAEKRTVPYEVVGLEKRTVQDTERVEADVHKEVAHTKGMGDVDVNESGSRNYGSMSWDEAMPQYQQRWQESYGSSGGRWQDYEPGYRYSHEMSNDPRFRDRDWNEVEPEFQRGYSDWSSRNGYVSEGNAWDRIRNNVRESWEEARARGSRR